MTTHHDESGVKVHRWRITDLVIITTLVFQLGGVLWMAATLVQILRSVQETVQELKVTVSGTVNRVSTLEINDAYQKGRIDAIDERTKPRAQR